MKKMLKFFLRKNLTFYLIKKKFQIFCKKWLKKIKISKIKKIYLVNKNLEEIFMNIFHWKIYLRIEKKMLKEEKPQEKIE